MGIYGDMMVIQWNMKSILDTLKKKTVSWLEHIPNIPRAEYERTKLPIQD
jgi:hypothetical protein